MSEQDDNFFSRWSRRKSQVRQGVATPAESAPAAVPSLPTAPAVARPLRTEGAAPDVAHDAAAGQLAEALAGTSPAQAKPAPPPAPTLEDVEALTPESDFSRFVARDVDATVKNSAMKKLFSDPHYNVMDGLDTYIDDYNTPNPLPKAMLRQLVQARMLGLLDDEMPEQPAAVAAQGDTPAQAAPGEVGGDSVAAAGPEGVDGEVQGAALPAPVDEGGAEVAAAMPAASAVGGEAQPAAGSASSAS